MPAYTAHHITDNPQIARQLLHNCRESRIMAFFGNLGAGKTTFIQSLCAELGVDEPVTSPTFGLVHSYPTPDGSEVHHFDFYRLKHEAEAFQIGVEDYLDSGDFCLIEWPERIPSLLPEDAATIRIEAQADGARIFYVECPE